MKRSFRFLGTVALAAIVSSAAHANLLTNGSFEQGTFSGDGNGAEQVAPGATTLPGWAVLNNTLSWDSSPSFNITAEDGNYYLDLTGYEDSPPFSGVSQSISTTVGSQYILTFYLGSDSGYDPAGDAITASAGSTSQTFTNQTTGLDVWDLETLDFTATSTSTLISLVGEAGDHYIGLDSVSVVAGLSSTPLPATLPLFTAGLGVLGLLGGRRKRKNVTATAA